MRAWIAVLLVALTALSGCAQDDVKQPVAAVDDEPDQGDNNDTALPPPTTNDTTPPPVDNTTVNAPPVLDLAADVLEGTVPFNVTLWINGTDDDNDTLSWSIASNGTELAAGDGVPANHTLSITDAGNHTFTVTLSDGQETVASNITVVAIEVVDPNAGLPEPIQFTGTTGVTAIFCDTQGDDSYTASDGYHYFDPAAVAGWQFELVVEDPFAPEWWTGADDWEYTGKTGTVPPGRDNVGVCPATDVGVIQGNLSGEVEYVMTLWHPDYVR